MNQNDLIILNAKITTLDCTNPEVEAVAISNGKFLLVGSEKNLAYSCSCTSACSVHGHDHAKALGGAVPAADMQTFLGTLGCGCWAI